MRRHLAGIALAVATMMTLAACDSVDEAGDTGGDASDTTADDEADDETASEIPPGPAAGESDIYGPIDPEASEGGTVTVGALNEPPSLDPFHEAADARTVFSVLMYQGLMYESSSGIALPLLAEEVDISDDELTYTFELRSDVTFHDGSDMTSADVKYSYDYIRDPDNGSPGAGDYNAIENIATPDDDTVVMELSEPNAALLMTLTNKYGGVVPEGYFDTDNAESNMNSESVGTGPYQLADFSPNESLTLTRNENYWGDGPFIDELVFQFVPNSSAMVVALENGRIDMGALPQIQDVRQVEATEDVEILSYPSLNQKAIDLDGDHELLGDELVRQAIAAAIDKEEVAQAAAPEMHQVLGTIVAGMQDTWGLPLEEVPYQEKDPEAARDLLAEAGYEDGFDLELTAINGFDWMDPAAVAITQQLADVGIQVTTEKVDLGTWIDRWSSKTPGFTLNDWGTQPDPSLLYYRHFHAPPDGADFRNWGNEEASELLDEGIATSDVDERIAIYQDFQRILAESSPTISLYSPTYAIAVNDRLANYVHHPAGWYFGLATAYVTD